MSSLRSAKGLKQIVAKSRVNPFAFEEVNSEEEEVKVP